MAAIRIKPARPPGTIATFSHVYWDGLPCRWWALYMLATASRRGLIPAVGAYSLEATVMSMCVGLWKQPSMSSSTWISRHGRLAPSGRVFFLLLFAVYSSQALLLFWCYAYLGGTLSQVCPFLRLVKEAKLASSLCAPYYTGGGTRGVKTSMGEVTSVNGVILILRSYSSRRKKVRVRWLGGFCLLVSSTELSVDLGACLCKVNVR